MVIQASSCEDAMQFQPLETKGEQRFSSFGSVALPLKFTSQQPADCASSVLSSFDNANSSIPNDFFLTFQFNDNCESLGIVLWFNILLICPILPCTFLIIRLPFQVSHQPEV